MSHPGWERGPQRIQHRQDIEDLLGHGAAHRHATEEFGAEAVRQAWVRIDAPYDPGETPTRTVTCQWWIRPLSRLPRVCNTSNQ